MRVEVVDDAEAVGRRSAEIVARVVQESLRPRLALPTGRTAVPLYRELARLHREGRFELGETRVYNLDELLLPEDQRSESFAAFMREHFVGPLGLDEERWEIPRADGDPQAESRRYDRVLDEATPLGLVVLGIGADGHVGYNLPDAVSERTHVVDVPDAVADTLHLAAEARPLRAVTMGLGPMRNARRLLLMASGEEKAAAVRALVLGREDGSWPASLLRRHPGFDVVIDRLAASGLSRGSVV